MNIIKYLEMTVHPRVVEYFMDELGEYQGLTGIVEPKRVFACVKLYNLMSQNRKTKTNFTDIHPSLGLFLHKHGVDIKYILLAIKETIAVDIKRCGEDPDGVDELEMTTILVGLDILYQIFTHEQNDMKVLLN